MLCRLLLPILWLACTWAQATTGPYDEAADARADIASALVQAAPGQRHVLVVFGANWCGDCKVLDAAFKAGAVAPLVAQRFQVVKVNVGRFDRNIDLAELYGVPLKKGIPAVVLLSPQGVALHATRSGELADARAMGDTGLYAFFDQMVRAQVR